MTTTPVYELLLKDVTDDLERKVLSALINHAGERVTRPQLVFEIFGKYVQSCELANNTDDRKIRECNVQKIVEFDRAYQALVVSGDKDGLCVALTQNISCVARMAEQAALGIEACKAVPFILFK